MPSLERKKLVLGIGFSPRKNGNSDTLLNWTPQGVKKTRPKNRPA